MSSPKTSAQTTRTDDIFDIFDANFRETVADQVANVNVPDLYPIDTIRASRTVHGAVGRLFTVINVICAATSIAVDFTFITYPLVALPTPGTQAVSRNRAPPLCPTFLHRDRNSVLRSIVANLF